MANRKKVLHLKSSATIVSSGNTYPKLPTAEQIEFGEIAVNYADGYETLAIKNSNGDIVPFANSSTIMEYVDSSVAGFVPSGRSISTASGLTGGGDLSENRTIGLAATGTAGTYGQVVVDEYGRVVSGSSHSAGDTWRNVKVNGTEVLSTDASSGSLDFTSGSTNGTISVAGTDVLVKGLGTMAYEDTTSYSSATEVNTALQGKQESGDYVSASTFTAHTADSSVHMSETEKENLDSLADNIAAISGISSSDITSWNNAATDSHTHDNKTYLDGISGTVGTMAYENASSYSSATEINNAITGITDSLSAKANTATTIYTASGLTGGGNLSEDRTIGLVSVGTGGTYTSVNVDSYGRVTGGSNTQYATNDNFTAHTADSSVHLSTTEKTNLDSLADNIATISGISSSNVSNWNTAYGWGNHANAGYASAAAVVASADYISSSHTISFKNVNGTEIDTLDASAFIKDGMVNNVEIKDVAGSGSCLVVTFNTDAGKDAINIPISSIFDANNYYTKTNIDDKLGSGFTGEHSSLTVTKAFDDIEEVFSEAINDLNDNKVSYGAFNEHTASTSHMNSTEKTNLDSLTTNIATISAITSSSASSWNSAAANSHTHNNKTYLDGITGSIGTMAYESASNYVPTGRTVSAGTGLSGGGNLGSNQTLSLATTGTAGTYYSVNTDSYGRVTGGSTSKVSYSASDVGAVPTGRTITTASGLTGGGNLSSDKTIGLAATGTSGTYGPTADVTGNNGNTIKVPQITTDAYGRVTSVTERTYTSVDHTYTIPTVNNGTFTVSGNGASVASTSANASANSGVNIKAGSFASVSTASSEITVAVSTGTSSSTVARGDHQHYWANVSTSASANYITEPEIKSVKINGSTTNAASSSNCQIQYDTTNKCLKFVFN